MLLALTNWCLYLVLAVVFYVKVWLVTSCVGSADIDSDGEFEGGLVEDIIGAFVALFIVVLPTKGISELLSAVGEFEIEGEIENAVSIIRAEPLLSVDGKTLADGKIVTGEGWNDGMLVVATVLFFSFDGDILVVGWEEGE